MSRPFGLRQRLTILYVSFFTVLLLARGWFFRETLTGILNRDAETLLSDEFAAAKRLLTVDEGAARWSYDRNDPDETRMALRVQSVLMLADQTHRVLQISESYRALEVNPAELRNAVMTGGQPVNQRIRDRNGVPYLVRSGLHQGATLLSVGLRLDNDERVVSEFTRSLIYGLPLAIFAVAALGWVVAGRALSPLNAVSQAAKTVTGSNLSVRLQRRGANDELDQLIDAFNGMVDRLESSFNQMRQFSANASHELRTPLTAIRSQLELALLTAKTSGQYREAVSNVMEDVEHLSDVVKALLYLSQAESGQVAIARDAVDLGALVEKVIEQFHLPAEAEGVRIECEFQPALVTGDRMQLQRLVSNLVSNALRFTPAGGRVTVRAGASNDAVTLEVSDTGCGIPAEHLPHIFERFYRVPEGSTRSRDRGLGLGLSFVSWIAKEHSARVDVESRVNWGSRFTVTFPRRQSAGKLPERESAPQSV